MDIPEIVAKMVDFESLVEPNEMVILGSHIGGWITDYELRFDEAKLRYSLAWEQMKYGVKGLEYEKPLSDKVTEVRMMRDPSHLELMRVKRTLSELKRYRSDLSRKVDVIMGIKRRS